MKLRSQPTGGASRACSKMVPGIENTITAATCRTERISAGGRPPTARGWRPAPIMQVAPSPASLLEDGARHRKHNNGRHLSDKAHLRWRTATNSSRLMHGTHHASGTELLQDGARLAVSVWYLTAPRRRPIHRRQTPARGRCAVARRWCPTEWRLPIARRRLWPRHAPAADGLRGGFDQDANLRGGADQEPFVGGRCSRRP